MLEGIRALAVEIMLIYMKWQIARRDRRASADHGATTIATDANALKHSRRPTTAMPYYYS